jgi:hypothetical protein
VAALRVGVADRRNEDLITNNIDAPTAANAN